MNDKIVSLTSYTEANVPIVMFDGRFSEGIYAVIAPHSLASILQLELQAGDDANVRYSLIAKPWFPGVLAKTQTDALKSLAEKIQQMTEVDFREVKDLYGHLNCVLEHDDVCSYNTFDGVPHRNLRALLVAAFPHTTFY